MAVGRPHRRRLRAFGAYEPELKSLPPHDALPAALTAPPPHDALPGDRRLELPDPSDARYLTVASRRLSDAALRGLNLQRHDKLVSLHVGGDWRSHSSRGCSSLRDTTPLAKALPAFRTLTALELPRNAIDDAGFLPLCDAIASPPLRLERLRFDANRLGDASAAALAAAAPLASLSVLALAHNCIGCAGAEALAAAGQLELIELNLAANEVGTRGALRADAPPRRHRPPRAADSDVGRRPLARPREEPVRGTSAPRRPPRRPPEDTAARGHRPALSSSEPRSGCVNHVQGKCEVSVCGAAGVLGALLEAKKVSQNI